MNSLDTKLKNLSTDMIKHTATFLPQLFAILSAIFTIPSVTKGMSNTPGRMHQNGSSPVTVSKNIFRVYHAE